ncbi:hypothetical protein [Nitrosomonas sp.]|uniref:beta strand repeat-containing protein n=1 Tax=Nitrosomonas sp. TaxID=42353 RepID=UPI00262A2EB5|nr:hypothetical protein [Nitrosomonas sp.]
MAIINGDDFNNTLNGTSGDDTINGKGGNDSLIGDLGNDFYDFSGFFGDDIITEAVVGGLNDTVRILSDIPASSIRLVGDGNDDLYIVADGFGSIRLVDHLLGAKVESLKLGAAAVTSLTGGLTFTGSINPDSLYGTAFNDVINGKEGNDFLTGRLGNDSYDFSDVFGDDTISEDTAGGLNDTIRILSDIPASSIRLVGDGNDDLYIVADGFGSIRLVDHLLGAKVESLKLGAAAATSLTGGLTFTGSINPNSLYGTAFNDVINGKEGNDFLTGRLGNDSYDFSGFFGDDTIIEEIVGGLNDTVRILNDIPASSIRLVGDGNDDLYIVADGFGSIRLIDHLLGAKVESLKLGAAAATSLAGGLTFTGSFNNNSLYGTALNDVFNGKGGNDSLIGRLGDDTYIVDNGGVSIFENLSEGTDIVKSSISFNLPVNVENLTLTGISDVNGVGNDLNNILIGNLAVNQLNGGLGNDTLNGNADTDTMIGGLGNDNYVVDNAGDIVTENLNEGTDKVSSSATFTLPNNVENLILTGASAINGSGNGSVNNLVGNSAANQLNGAGGNDTLDGGTGNNTLTGGIGQDTFKLTSAGHIDAITDFIVADDTIQLENAVFTALTTPGTLAVGQLKVGTQALDANDFVVYNNVTGALLYDADASGAGAAVQIATLSAGLALTNVDFVVI